MDYEKSKLNQVKRGWKKASYKQQDVFDILDASEICHIAFNYEGRAFVQPINFGRHEDKLYVHGSYKNRMTTALVDAEEICLNVMVLDGMKLTRSAFHHSVNYRSVMVFGTVRELESDEDKLIGLKAIINHFVPNRWEHCRPPDDKELKATRVLEISIDSASCKIANTPTEDKEMDLSSPYWAGIIPVQSHLAKAIPSEDLDASIELPEHISDFIESKNANRWTN